MSRAQLQKAPIWPASLPSPEVLERGYSESWYHVCKETGVGEYMPGKCFQLNSGKRIRSVVRDIEREVAAGRAPVLPMPLDTIYTTFPYSDTWASPSNDLEEIAEERESSLDGRQLKEISSNEVQLPASSGVRKMNAETETKKRKDIDLMPPPPSRLRRQGTARKAHIVPEESARVRHTEPVEIEVSRSASHQPGSQGALEDTCRAPIPTSQPEGLVMAASTTRSADPSLARRPRAVRRNLPSQETIPIEAAAYSSDKVPEKNNPPARTIRSRARPTPPEVIQVYDEQEKPERCLVLPPPPTMKADLPIPKTSSPLSDSSRPETDPEAVLERLCTFRDNLAAALEKKKTAPPRRAVQQPAKPLPFISRWVDYSRKYGVGYMLEDGTIGCIVNSDREKGTPVTHVVVRNGEYWLTRVTQQWQSVNIVPFRIWEDRGAAGIQTVSQTPRTSKDKERIRQLRTLWWKFGKYMNASLNGSEDATSDENERLEEDGNLNPLFVRLYQRLGNVGVWVYSDGSVQVSAFNKPRPKQIC